MDGLVIESISLLTLLEVGDAYIPLRSDVMFCQLPFAVVKTLLLILQLGGRVLVRPYLRKLNFLHKY
ncbi:hypothetical protein CKQ84_19830 [Shewanella sp. WE21]|jgi:hypothetical protein|nr:hypothetical protein CKQ84_19830 [Shewanella sp. WE21]